MLENNHAGPEADYWALGCTIFKLMYGRVPFDGDNENLTFEKIMKGD